MNRQTLAYRNKWFLTIVVALLLSACGGGGGGGGGDGSGGGDDGDNGGGSDGGGSGYSFIIDDENYGDVMRVTFLLKDTLEGLGSIGSAYDSIYIAIGDFVNFVPSGSVTADCFDGGTYTLDWGDNDGSESISQGDTFDIQFSDCYDSLYAWSLTSGRTVITLINPAIE